MSFKITARTILQLGAELISSDAIAFYELIKNSFDAGSNKVEVRIVKRFPQAVLDNLISEYSEIEDENITDLFLAEFKEEIFSNLDQEATEVPVFKGRISNASNRDDLILLLKKANYILIKDQGEGMSLLDLDDIYLTIGTRNRRSQRAIETNTNRPILGEKGLGRLSVMRLGEGLKVETTQAGDTNYSELEIDWSIFSHDSDALLESIPIEPRLGKLKTNLAEKGTKIYIYDLLNDWTINKIKDISKSQLGRFIDPFGRTNRDFITLFFNNQPVQLIGIDRKLFEFAHAIVRAKLDFTADNKPVFSGEIDYKSYNRQNTFSLTDIHLASVLDKPKYVELLTSLGPFKVEIYWFNRKLLTKNEGVLDAPYIKELVNTWGGGLMVYRDGFRVNPYGGPNDDWLNLDAVALASPGYKLNRKQIVGKVDISSNKNSKLLDQTNREGLRENPEKEALISLLQFLIWKELKTYLDVIKKDEDQNLAALSLSDIERRISSGQSQVRAAVKHLKDKFPEISNETEALTTIEEVLKDSVNLFKIAKASSDTLEDRLKTTMNLAGLGLMIDVIAHELNRSTEHAISTINSLPQNISDGVSATMNTLRVQLKTLQTRLKVIDPLGPSGRQQKVTTNLKKIIRETADSHVAQFERHNIKFELTDTNDAQDWTVKVVPGMIVQVLENLISNSVYWIKQKQNIDINYRGNIRLTIDRNNETIMLTDNGPGIPREKKEEIFRPFFSTKPPGDGKGLGLYISREIAKYHNAALFLVENNLPVLNTFALILNNT